MTSRAYNHAPKVAGIIAFDPPTASGHRRSRACSSNGSAWRLSCRWPGVAAAIIVLPERSATKCRLFPSPRGCCLTQDRYSLFAGPRGVWKGPDIAAIDHRQGAIQCVVVNSRGLGPSQNLAVEAGQPQTAVAQRDGAPVALLLGLFTPGRPGSQHPADAVEDGAMILGGAPRQRPLGWVELSEVHPLLFRQLMASLGSHAPNLPCPLAHRSKCLDGVSRQRIVEPLK